MNGGLEAGETLLEGALREVREEAGPRVRVRPLGVVHAFTFRCDAALPFMLAVDFLFAPEGGAVEPVDDMAGSAYRWWSLAELPAERPRLAVPTAEPCWLLKRPVELFRLWRDRPLPAIPHPSGGWN